MVSVGDIHGGYSQGFHRVNDVLLEGHIGSQLKSKLACVVWMAGGGAVRAGGCVHIGFLEEDISEMTF